MSFGPGLSAGMLQFSVVPEATAQFAARTPPGAVPTKTMAPGWNPVPVRVTPVPPVSAPLFGVILVRVGAAKAGAAWPVARKAAICMTHVPAARVAVAP